MSIEYYICNHCGNIITKTTDKKVPVSCCGEKMTLLVPGAKEGATEKHIPVIVKDGNIVTVTVGSVEHPMGEDHWIQWISIETDKGSQIKYLTSKDRPQAQFALAPGETLIAAYEYCNLHGFWKAEA